MEILYVIGGLLYLLPSFIAYKRKHHQGGPILVINIFLGWTVLGWLAALVWSVSAIKQADPQTNQDESE